MTTAADHVVRVLRERPGVQQEGPEVGELQRAVAADRVADRVLHERVGADDEVAGQPAPDEQRDARRRSDRAGPSRCSPKTSRPRKLDSRKNANSPSIASVWPMTPPAYRENAAQLVPNWNSIGMPVTTPTAKLMPKIRIQNRAASFQRASPVRSAERLQHDDEQREAHRELREEVVVDDREGELQPVPENGIGHERSGGGLRARLGYSFPAASAELTLISRIAHQSLRTPGPASVDASRGGIDGRLSGSR